MVQVTDDFWYLGGAVSKTAYLTSVSLMREQRRGDLLARIKHTYYTCGTLPSTHYVAALGLGFIH